MDNFGHIGELLEYEARKPGGLGNALSNIGRRDVARGRNLLKHRIDGPDYWNVLAKIRASGAAGGQARQVRYASWRGGHRPHRILSDDEPKVLDGLTRVLRRESYDILTANSAEEAAGLLNDNSVDLIVSDEEMPGMSGTEFLGKVAQQYPDTVRIVLTGHPTLPAALRAINEGKV